MTLLTDLAAQQLASENFLKAVENVRNHKPDVLNVYGRWVWNDAIEAAAKLYDIGQGYAHIAESIRKLKK